MQTPALLAAPPQARGPVLGQIVPRQVSYLLRLGEVTVALGAPLAVIPRAAGGDSGAGAEVTAIARFS